MGITGLLPFLEHATKPCHISEFRGATVVVDTYCWLHKGANACAAQLARGEDAEAYVHYCMKYVKMLQSHNIRPILVFDGKNLPAKAETEAKRRELRQRAKQRAAELLRLGKTEEAQTYLKQCVNVTPEMASKVIKECHKNNVDCIVAPYESDAQLAFFNKKGVAELVITEDSDLVLFGCSKVIFKLDLQGCGYLVEAEKIPAAMKLRPDKYTFDKFRNMCILAGCDYINSLHGIGLKKALKFISLTEETNPEIFLDKVPRYLNMRHLEVTDVYKENFMVAEATFRHQTVFDPFKKKLVPLTDPEVTGTNPKYCKNAGDLYDHETAYQVALGNLHPTTLKKLNDWSPRKPGSSNNSIWSGVCQKSQSIQTQKAQFKDFFKSRAKVVAKLEVINDEQSKIEEDVKIEKELEFYSRKSVDLQNPGTSQPVVSTEESPKKEITSPVLQRNPFVVKKKLSRFHITSTDSKVIVKSRYFSSQFEEVSLKKTVDDEDRQEIIKNQLTSSEQQCNERIRLKTEENIQIIDTIDSNELNLSNLENIPDNKNTDSSEKTKLEKENVGQINCTQDPSNDECSIVLEEGIEETDKLPEIKILEKSPKESNDSKRKKLGPCRSVGLKRTKSEGQQTIQFFFGNMKKPN